MRYIVWTLGLLFLGVVVLFATADTKMPPVDVSFEPAAVGPTLRFFKTPQVAVEKVGALVEDGDWDLLSQFYDLPKDADTAEALTSLRYFTEPDPLTGHRPPFDEGFRFKDILRTEYEGVFEVVVSRVDPATGQETLQFFYVKRYPEGYRILTARPSEDVDDGFQ